MAPPHSRSPNAAGPKGDARRNNSSITVKGPGEDSVAAQSSDGELQSSMAELSVRSGNPSSKPVALTELGNITRSGLRFDDEQTHLSASSIKPGSLDGKSTVSGATFALDEKESLRPDDSASVKAAEEEESCSGNGSGAPNSRVGSEAGGRAFRDQFHEISERIGHAPGRSMTVSHGEIPGIKEESIPGPVSPLQRAVQAVVVSAEPSAVPANAPVVHIEYRNPDEKLLEALESPKDRLYVLRLERDIIDFVQHSSDQILDLRTPNSFCRLLAHKLADYYALTHHVDGAMSAVRLYRTPYCRIRTPLSSYSQSSSSNDNAMPTQPAVKIMRRAGLAKDGHRTDSGPDTTASSIAPSKAGSETGDDSGRVTGLVSPTESSISKDKSTMTREEREAKYKETRERIFKGFPDADSTDVVTNNETGLGISRSSSANGKRKTRKQRNLDDGFEARSHYTAYYPTMQYTGPAYDQTSAPSAHFNSGIPQQYPSLGDPNSMNPTMYPPMYGSGYQSMPSTPGYPVPVQQYPMTGNSTMNGPNQMQPFPGYVQQMPYQYYQQPQPSPALGQHSPIVSSPALSNSAQLSRPQSQAPDQQWASMAYQYQCQHQYQYQQPKNQQPSYLPQNQSHNTVQGAQTVQYQYGQLPCPPNLPGSRNAHPLPGSYNRQQALNPQIRSFVPTSSSQPSPFIGHTAQDASLNHQYPSMSGNAPGPPPNIPSNHTTHVAGILQFGSFTPTSEPKSLPSRKGHSNLVEGHTPGKSTLAKWGTPANLPPKPPPPDPPSIPEGRHSLPQSVPAPPTLAKLSNGQALSTF
ncbi:MAG: hypothetical protein Q9216_001361 [Gyalolechia sp. 2 TL-2023]